MNFLLMASTIFSDGQIKVRRYYQEQRNYTEFHFSTYMQKMDQTVDSERKYTSH